MASVIANEFTEADHAVYLSALIELGLVLFLVTVVINMIGKRIIKKFYKRINYECKRKIPGGQKQS